MRSIPRLKICCISSIEEAQIAIRGGAAAVGLVSDMPSGPGVISEPLIAEIARTIPPGIASFLLTSQQQVGEILAQQRRCRTSVIQLCDRLTDGTYDDLREALPGISLVQVIHVTGPEALDEALAAAPQVNGLLLDSGNPTLEVKQLGGTGRTHNWEISREIRIRSQVPVFLAGGLNPDNVAEAVRMVEPFGVDVCSGVRTDG
ncbi:MAG: phosphoribosylanthranilate isomerase, partial [Calditrichota bacterium]